MNRSDRGENMRLEILVKINRKLTTMSEAIA